MSIRLSLLMFIAGLLQRQALDPSFPEPVTGAPSCINPIRQLICTVDTKTGFVAGMEYGAGPDFGFRSVCSRGTRGRATLRDTVKDLGTQVTWDMTDVTDPSFPPTTAGVPNRDYFFPLGGLITQMIVLEAPNPNGPAFGDIPAIIFRYFTPRTSRLGMAICGNAIYAKAYLLPFANTAPPTPVSLKSVFGNPLSATTQAFLASFQGKCAPRTVGFLTGDPRTSSDFHLQLVYKVCFAPVDKIVIIPPPERPEEPPEAAYDWDVPYSPCYFDYKDAKKSTSFSCAASGQTVATGKYSAIFVNQTDQSAFEAVRSSDGNLEQQQWSGQVYLGSQPQADVFV